MNCAALHAIKLALGLCGKRGVKAVRSEHLLGIRSALRQKLHAIAIQLLPPYWQAQNTTAVVILE
jgi:hypothetical protein